jgi:putative SOS response-associated peptidase YedK
MSATIKSKTNPFWRDSFVKRRCLVPASSFCEPNGDVKPATWHWFAIKGEGERPLFAFPGIWKAYKGPMKKDGPNVGIETYSFLTTTPNHLVATINHERMPVLLTREDEFQTWLTGSADVAFALARAHGAGGVRQGRPARRTICLAKQRQAPVAASGDLENLAAGRSDIDRIPDLTVDQGLRQR